MIIFKLTFDSILPRKVYGSLCTQNSSVTICAVAKLSKLSKISVTITCSDHTHSHNQWICLWKVQKGRPHVTNSLFFFTKSNFQITTKLDKTMSQLWWKLNQINFFTQKFDGILRHRVHAWFYWCSQTKYRWEIVKASKLSKIFMMITCSDHVHDHNQGFGLWKVQKIRSHFTKSFFSITKLNFEIATKLRKTKSKLRDLTFLTRNFLVF